MAFKTEHKIPVINFSEEKFKPGSDSWILASKQIRYGLEEYGCFEIVYDKFPGPQLHNSIFFGAKDFFDLPMETKMRKTSDTPGALSYSPPRPATPLYENVGIESPTTLEKVQHFTNVMWPQGNDRFCESVHSFSRSLVEIMYETITRMVFEEYGVEGLYDSFMESTFYLFRFFKYTVPKMNESDVGAGPHSDSTFISILHQQVKGLQIKTKDGQWIDAKASSSSFLFLAGDILMAWSNDRVRTCEHRVIINENKERYSLGLFSFIKGVIHVPKELVDEEHPLQYKPIDNDAYRPFYASEEARKCACSIKAFCGI